MAEFKVFRGPEKDLTLEAVPFHDGYVYFTNDKGNFYIDTISNGEEKRILVNDEAASKAVEVEIKPTDWQENENKYSYTLKIKGLTCGQKGNVPPIITYSSNQIEYSKIESAEADPDAETIKFIIAERPTNTIGLIITDNR